MLCQVVLAADLVLDRLDGLTFLNHVHTSGSHSGTALLNLAALHLIQLHSQHIHTLRLSSPSFISIDRYFALPLLLFASNLCVSLPSSAINTIIRSLTITFHKHKSPVQLLHDFLIPKTVTIHDIAYIVSPT